MAGFSDLYMKDCEQEGREREKVQRRESGRRTEGNVEMSERGISVVCPEKLIFPLPGELRVLCHNDKEERKREEGKG